MNFKVGDRVYVKGTYKKLYVSGINGNLVWVEYHAPFGKTSVSYQIEHIVNEQYPYYSSEYFSNHFITEQEYRKIKLEKINESR